jgi:hypothetical protein
MLSQRLIVIAGVVAFGSGDIAILVIVVLDHFGRRFLAAVLGRLTLVGLLAGSTHKRVPAGLTVISPSLPAILTARCVIFTAFFRGSV